MDLYHLIWALTDAEIHALQALRSSAEDSEGELRYKLLAALSAALMRLHPALAGESP